jgi:hypothetical protein
VAGGGPGAGGSGNGSGIGSGRGTPAPTPKPTVAPTPVPTTPPPVPTIDPATLMHVQGRVVDSVTRQGSAGVCVAYGTTTCLGAILTDANGDYAVDLSIGRVLNWGLTYIASGYQRTTVNIRGRPGTVTQNIFLRKSP